MIFRAIPPVGATSGATSADQWVRPVRPVVRPVKPVGATSATSGATSGTGGANWSHQ